MVKILEPGWVCSNVYILSTIKTQIDKDNLSFFVPDFKFLQFLGKTNEKLEFLYIFALWSIVLGKKGQIK